MARPRRLDAFAYVGCYRYFLTFCTEKRRPAFLDASVVELVIQQFRVTATHDGFSLLAYCLMPDHAHLLVEGLTDAADLRHFVKLAKQRSGALFARRFGRSLWQSGYFERVLRERDDALECARYIVANPVRAGLVAHPADYPNVGSDVYPLDALLESVTTTRPGR